MKLSILNFYYAPDFSADVPILSGLVDGLAARGHEVRVIAAAPHRQGGRVWPEYRGRPFWREEAGRVRVERTWVYSRPDMSMRGRAWNYLSYSMLAVPAALRGPRPDLLFVPTPPPNMGLTGMLAAFARRVPFVLNVQDMYPDVAVRAGVLRAGRVVSAFQRMENAVYRRAARVTVVSEGFRRNLRAKGVAESKLAVIPNFVDTDLIRPLPPDTSLRRDLGLGDRTVVLYAGSLGHPQGLDRVLEAAALLRDRGDLVFLFVGDGSRKTELEALAREWSLPNVRFLPPRPWEEVPQVLATGDISLVPLRKGFGLETVPSKLYGIMASGRPVITSVDRGCDTWMLAETAGCGLGVSPEDSRELAVAIARLADDPTLARRLGDAGRTYAVEHFSRARVVDRYEALFDEVAAEWNRRRAR
ncbi:MAG: glycosyltransferase family 4 protein [Candidatus Rokuibacteriota bacterium]